MRTKATAVGAEQDRLNDEVMFQRTKVERLRVTFVANADFVELSKGCMAAKKPSFDRERKDFEARI